MSPKEGFRVLKESAQEWINDQAPRLSAALAYYTLFSIAPLLVIALTIAGFVLGEEAARGQILSGAGEILGPKAAGEIQTMIANANRSEGGALAGILSGFVLLFGAAAVFNQLKNALNTIWEVPKKEGGGIASMLRERLLTFGMVLAVGFLLLVSLLVSSALNLVAERAGQFLPMNEAVWQVINLAVALAVITLLFAVLFRYLPDRRVPWRDVWTGAIFTALLFVVGKFLIGLYLGRSATASTFGAAGSLVIILIWLYYSGMIFFFGAEFTEVYSRVRGSRRGEAPACLLNGETVATPSMPLALPPMSVKKGSPSKRARNKGTSKAALLGAGVVGAVVGLLGAVIGATALAFKGVRKLLGG